LGLASHAADFTLQAGRWEAAGYRAGQDTPLSTAGGCAEKEATIGEEACWPQPAGAGGEPEGAVGREPATGWVSGGSTYYDAGAAVSLARVVSVGLQPLMIAAPAYAMVWRGG